MSISIATSTVTSTAAASNLSEEQAFADFPATARPCVLVLAAGKGERFKASGGHCHKLQADIAPGTTVLQATLAAVQASGLPWHVEQGPHPGMGDSIAAAVAACSDVPGWLILPADLPLITPQSLQAVALALMQAQAAETMTTATTRTTTTTTASAQSSEIKPPSLYVIQPRWHGQTGHPVAFAGSAGKLLQQLSGDQGAAVVVQQAAQQGGLQRLELPDQGVVLDVDTLPLLEQARALWQQRLQAQAMSAQPAEPR